MIQIYWPSSEATYSPEAPSSSTRRRSFHSPSSFVPADSRHSPHAFGFAKEGRIYDAALPSLMIIGLGVWGLRVIHLLAERLNHAAPPEMKSTNKSSPSASVSPSRSLLDTNSHFAGFTFALEHGGPVFHTEPVSLVS